MRTEKFKCNDCGAEREVVFNQDASRAGEQSEHYMTAYEVMCEAISKGIFCLECNGKTHQVLQGAPAFKDKFPLQYTKNVWEDDWLPNYKPRFHPIGGTQQKKKRKRK